MVQLDAANIFAICATVAVSGGVAFVVWRVKRAMTPVKVVIRRMGDCWMVLALNKAGTPVAAAENNRPNKGYQWTTLEPLLCGDQFHSEGEAREALELLRAGYSDTEDTLVEELK